MDNENQRELDVLAALEGIHRMQESIRDTELDMVVETGIIFLRLHYQRLPPDKPRLNRKKFARETWAEWKEFFERDPILAEVRLLRAVEFIAGPEVPKITPEQIGVFKTLKIAIELDKFLRRLEAEGRKQYTIGELFDEVFFPVWKL